MPARVLVADDDASICRALQRVLTRRGMIVETAGTGAEAVAALAEQSFDAMIVDWKLGPDDGLAIVRAAQELEPAPHVLFMTGYDVEYIEDVALALGAAACYRKPVSGTTLAKKIRQLLGQGSGGFCTAEDDRFAAETTARALTAARRALVWSETTQTAAAVRAPHPLKVAEPGTIAVVDDDPSALLEAQRVLLTAWHEVVAFLNAREAFAYATREELDLVVCDIDLPHLSGLELVDDIRQLDRDVACVLMTAAPSYEGVKAAMARGATRYLEKPVSPGVLREAAAAGVKAARHARRHRLLLEEVGMRATPHSADFPTVDQLLEQALQNLHAVAHPVVLSQSPEMILGYLLEYRSDVPAMRTEVAIRLTAERTGRGSDMRRRMLEVATSIFRTILPQQLVFVRVLPEDLADTEVFGPDGPLRGEESRFVLRLVGPRPLRYTSGAFEALLELRERGARLSVEHSGSDAPSLDEETASRLGADFVCLSPSLVTEDGLFPQSEAHLVETIRAFARHGTQVVATGITTPGEAVTMRRIGCAMLAGPIFDLPGRECA
jgi:DNA-binding NtrC family response regulator